MCPSQSGRPPLFDSRTTTTTTRRLLLTDGQTGKKGKRHLIITLTTPASLVARPPLIRFPAAARPLPDWWTCHPSNLPKGLDCRSPPPSSTKPVFLLLSLFRFDEAGSKRSSEELWEEPRSPARLCLSAVNHRKTEPIARRILPHLGRKLGRPRKQRQQDDERQGSRPGSNRETTGFPKNFFLSPQPLYRPTSAIVTVEMMLDRLGSRRMWNSNELATNSLLLLLLLFLSREKETGKPAASRFSRMNAGSRSTSIHLFFSDVFLVDIAALRRRRCQSL